MRGFLLFILALVLLVSRAEAQSYPYHYLSAASNNATLVWPPSGSNLATPRALVKLVLPINTTSTIYYLHLYNKGTAPVCGTDVPVMTIPVPQSSGAGGGVSTPTPDGLYFPLGFGFCLTGGIADNDNTNAAAGVALNFGVTGY